MIMFWITLMLTALMHIPIMALSAQEYYERGQDQDVAGDYRAALNSYQQAVAQNPLHMPAWFALGIHHAAHNQLFRALHCFEKAAQLDPACPEIHYNVGLVHESLNDADKAIACMHRALQQNPHYEKAAQKLKALTQSQKKIYTIQEYKELTQKAIDTERYADACSYLQDAFAYRQPNPMDAFELACLCTQLGMTDQAIAGFNQVCTVSPGNKSALYNIAFNHKIAGNIDTAIGIFQDLLKQHPDYSNAQFSLARAHIKKGNFAIGWEQSIPYFKESGKYAPELRTLLANNSLKGKKILLRPEGHFGDTIQFIRHAQTLKEQGAITIACIQQELIPLLSRCPYIDQLLPLGSHVPIHDASATLMSMPAILNVTEHTIPREIPYIFPDPTLVDEWRIKLAEDNKFKIGICWQASVRNDASRPPIARRGIPLNKLYALGSMENVSLYCLQKMDGLDELKNAPDSFVLHRFDEDFDGAHGRFMDTAAVMQHLDLVITVDTAIAHLAGALGIPVWVMLPYETDWRWIQDRTDSPWYPTMRLFQQPKPFDWDTVANQIIDTVRTIA